MLIGRIIMEKSRRASGTVTATMKANSLTHWPLMSGFHNFLGGTQSKQAATVNPRYQRAFSVPRIFMAIEKLRSEWKMRLYRNSRLNLAAMGARGTIVPEMYNA